MSDSEPVDPDQLDWLTLSEGERVVWSDVPHKSSLVPALVVGIPLSFLLVGLFIIAAAYLQRENTQYVVTTDALYTKTGVLSRDVQRIDFGKVQNTSYSQGVFGSWLGYGTVEISTAGGSGIEMAFNSVPDPRAVQERINERLRDERAEKSAEDADETPEAVLDDIRNELRAIRAALEDSPEVVVGEPVGDEEPTDEEEPTVDEATDFDETIGDDDASEAGPADR